jgi:hypothetical protein
MFTTFYDCDSLKRWRSFKPSLLQTRVSARTIGRSRDADSSYAILDSLVENSGAFGF